MNRVCPTNPFVEFEDREIEQSIPDRFAAQVARHPDRVAVKSRQHEFTCREFDREANRVAQALLALHGEGEERVAVLLEHGAPLLAAILGILKAGKTYVPLDPYYPSSRLEYMLQDTGAGALLTNTGNLALARELAGGGTDLVNVDELDAALSAADPGLGISPDTIAYILHTSGSTGRPKGVMQSHRNVLHETMNYTNGCHICEDDRLLLISSCSFGGAVRTIYAGLLNGATLCPLDIKEEGLAPLARWLIDQRVTVFRSVATAFRHFAGGLNDQEGFPIVRLIYLAGESVYSRDIELFRRHFGPDCILVNGLGSGESFTYRWFFIDRDTEISGSNVPVGYPLAGQETLLLDEAGQQVAEGEMGEIAVRSRYLSPGYWQRPDLTAEKFLPDLRGGGQRIYLTGDMGRLLPDGCLLHMGRKDFQVKIRGYRIETAEVEAALLQMEGVKDAVVAAREDGRGERRLAAYLVPEALSAPNVTELRRFLADRLPDYMVPSAFVTVDAIPITPSGKIDRRSLPEPGRERPDLEALFVAPSGPVEEALADIWAEVLDLEQVGVEDTFLELGGHSLLATQLVSRVRQQLGVDLSVADMFSAATIARQAPVVETRLLEQMDGLREEEAQRMLDGEAE